MQDAFGEVGGPQQGQGMNFPGPFEVRDALLVAFIAAFELRWSLAFLLPGRGRRERDRCRTPQPCQDDANAGIEANEAERNYTLFIAAQRCDPDLLAVRMQRADNPLGMK